MNRLKLFLKQRLHHWLSKRIPPAQSHVLSSKNIFIFPSRFGFAYILCVCTLFVLGTNYQNNIIILFTYLLSSFFITVMLHSFFNLARLTIQSQARQTGFANQHMSFPIIIKARDEHFDFTAQFTDVTDNAEAVKINQCYAGDNSLVLNFTPTKRGKFHLGRVRFRSEYSFGLFQSWSVLDFNHHAIVYPQPIGLSRQQYTLSSVNEGAQSCAHSNSIVKGIEDFSELKSFVQGESRARTAWKQLAKGQGHYSKHYQGEQGSLVWLRLSDMPAKSLEMQLSHLCFLVCEYSQSDQRFGLVLDAKNKPVITIEPDAGHIHQQACLSAMALY